MLKLLVLWQLNLNVSDGKVGYSCNHSFFFYNNIFLDLFFNIHITSIPLIVTNSSFGYKKKMWLFKFNSKSLGEFSFFLNLFMLI